MEIWRAGSAAVSLSDKLVLVWMKHRELSPHSLYPQIIWNSMQLNLAICIHRRLTFVDIRYLRRFLSFALLIRIFITFTIRNYTILKTIRMDMQITSATSTYSYIMEICYKVFFCFFLLKAKMYFYFFIVLCFKFKLTFKFKLI